MSKNTQDAGYNTAVSGAKKIVRILVYLLVLLAIVLAGRTAFGFGYDIFGQKPADSEMDAQEVTVTITDEMSINDVGKLLESKGLIEKSRVFWIQEKLSDYSGEMKPGTYVLNTAQTVEEMLKVMSSEETEGGDGE